MIFPGILLFLITSTGSTLGRVESVSLKTEMVSLVIFSTTFSGSLIIMLASGNGLQFSKDGT